MAGKILIIQKNKNMNKIIIIPFIIFCSLQGLWAQNYSSLRVKEEYDLLNTLQINKYKPCSKDPKDDGGTFGDGMSYILDGYITMYKTTGDKAYLYKFIMQSLCIMKNRHDLAGVDSKPRWDDTITTPNNTTYPQMNREGYIIGAMARFVYYVRMEEPALKNMPLYQFPEIANNYFAETFSTLGQFANWLGVRVNETLNWFIANGYWNNSFGFSKHPNENYATHVNWLIGFARALLFMGLSDPNYDYQQKALIIANLFKSNVNFHDPCEGKSYNAPMLRWESNNTYWWYHHGWRVYKRNCGIYFKVPKYSEFIKYLEDISHGGVVMFLPLEYYDYQPSTPFTTSDMIRFRNTFTKNIYDGNGGFHNAMNGDDNPIGTCTDCLPNQFKMRTLAYMPYERFDGADATATSPNVYNIIMDFYASNIANSTAFGVAFCSGYAKRWECVNGKDSGAEVGIAVGLIFNIFS